MVSSVHWTCMHPLSPFRLHGLDVLPFAVKHGEDMDRSVGSTLLECVVLCHPAPHAVVVLYALIM